VKRTWNGGRTEVSLGAAGGGKGVGWAKDWGTGAGSRRQQGDRSWKSAGNHPRPSPRQVFGAQAAPGVWLEFFDPQRLRPVLFGIVVLLAAAIALRRPLMMPPEQRLETRIILWANLLDLQLIQNGLFFNLRQTIRFRHPRKLKTLASGVRSKVNIPRHQGCSKVWPVEGRACSAALKSEDRRPKPERRPKSEFREWPDSTGGCSAGVAINSDLGLRVSFGLRSSGLGFGMDRTDFREALPPAQSGLPYPHEPALFWRFWLNPGSVGRW
jgi:hypothetical protein